MMIGLTGTPGTGKSTLSHELEERGYPVTHLADTIGPYIIEEDKERDTLVVDEEAWAREFCPVDGIVEGHLAQYLPCDRIIVLRCRPDVLAQRLKKRNYSEKKIRENVEAEALDIILQETVERFRDEQIYEIDTTSCGLMELTEEAEKVIQGTRPPTYGMIDWSEYLLGGI
jgi:adenylate kinase